MKELLTIGDYDRELVQVIEERNGLAQKLSHIMQEAKLMCFAASEAVDCINEELGACGRDEVRDHPVLSMHEKKADALGAQIKKTQSAISKIEGTRP